jgi:hypothetical protein
VEKRGRVADLDPQQIERKDPDPGPHPCDKLGLDSDQRQFADDKPECMECEPF